MSSPSDDLVEFVRARLAEDEQSARRASKLASPEWHLDEHGETVLWWPPEPKVAAAERRHGIEVTADVWRGQTIEFGDTDIAQHIARWDPARVLADIEAKRGIVDAYVKWSAEPQAKLPDYKSGFTAGLEAAVQALAATYSDHPDYREGWRL